MTDTRACVDWFDWDIWISDEPGPCGDFGSLLLRTREDHR